MTQIVVQFLQNIGTVGSPDFEIDRRIFDFEISTDAQKYYNYQMYQILKSLHAEVVDASGTAHDVDTLGLNGTMTAIAAGAKIQFDGTVPSAAEITTIQLAIGRLNAWSEMRNINDNGYQTYQIDGVDVTLDSSGNVPSGTAPPKFSPDDYVAAGVAQSISTTMDQYMAQGLDKLVRTLRSAGWDPLVGGDATGALTAVTGTDSTIYNVNGILGQSVSAAAQAHIIGNAMGTDSRSLQQVLMVDYVSRGNEILFNEMTLLKEAIDINQQSLSYLNALQDLMNQKDPQKFILQLQDLNGVQIANNPQSQYDNFEKDTYNQALGTIAKFQGDGNLVTYLNGLSATDPTIPGGTPNGSTPLSAQAFVEINNAVATFGTISAATIIRNLEYLRDEITSKGGSSGSGLVGSINKIISDFQSLPPPNPVQTWIQDVQEGKEGQFQRDLGNAIVSSQSFNDTQRENLREVMFVFEEFYKSATGLLSRLTQLIEKMADGIAR